jgi:hypothetical protein
MEGMKTISEPRGVSTVEYTPLLSITLLGIAWTPGEWGQVPEQLESITKIPHSWEF